MALVHDTTPRSERVWIIQVGTNYLGHKGRYNNIPTWVKTEEDAEFYSSIAEILPVLQALQSDAGLQHLKITVYSKGLIPTVVDVPPEPTDTTTSTNNVVSLFKR